MGGCYIEIHPNAFATELISMIAAKIEQEVTDGGHPFRRKVIFQFMIQYLCPIFAAIILISSVANAFGWISM